MESIWLSTLFEKEQHTPTVPFLNEKIMGNIQADGIAAQVYTLLKQRERLEFAANYQDVLKKSYDQTLYANLFIKRECSTLLKILESEAIPAIPLKGVYFAEKYFGSLGGRGTSDIDLLIENHTLARVIELVMSLGFTIEEPPIKGHFHCSFSKVIPNSPYPLTIEVHWNLLKEESSNLVITDFWQEATPLGDYKYIKQLSDYHTFYMICLHGWRHNLDSMKYFIDIIQLIYVMRESLDYNRLLNDAKRHQTWRRVTRTLSIVYQEHPYLQNVVPFPLALRKTLWEAQAFQPGRRSSLKNYLDYCDYQFLSYDRPKHVITEVKNWCYELWQAKKGQSASS